MALRSTPSGIGEAPYRMKDRSERSNSAKRGWLTSMLIMVGTNCACVTFSRAMVCSTSIGSKRATKACRPPDSVTPKVEAPSARWNIAPEWM